MSAVNSKVINSGPSVIAAASPLRATPIMSATPARRVDALKELKLDTTTRIAAMRQRHAKTLAEIAREKRAAELELDKVCGDLARAMAGNLN